MKVIGFSFLKLSAERLKDNQGELKINTEIEVPEINSIKTNIFKGKDELIDARFNYIVTYGPEIAKIEIKGSVVFSLEPKLAKQILKDWKKKKITEEFKLVLFNVILRKSSLKALELEDKLNLPLHIPMPSFRKPKDE